MDNRRKFLRNAALTGLALGVLPAVTKANSFRALKTPPPPCFPTTLDYYGEGPFYTAAPPSIGADFQLALADEPGDRLIISGVVRNLDCTEIIPNAVIDIWQANDAGEYDNTGGYHLRGKTTSNASGIYIFETIQPGKYLNGDSYRPSHIHLKITAPGYPTITTQIYFAGDTSIPDDAAASITSGTYDATHRIIDLTANVEGKLEGNWDIIVDGDGTNVVGIEDLHIENGMIYNAVPNPFQERLEIKYGVFKPANVSISISDVQGRVVATLKEEFHKAQKYTAEWSPSAYLNDGYYFVIIRVNDLQVHHLKVLKKSGY